MMLLTIVNYPSTNSGQSAGLTTKEMISIVILIKKRGGLFAEAQIWAHPLFMLIKDKRIMKAIRLFSTIQDQPIKMLTMNPLIKTMDIRQIKKR
jgi:hypothetical protein